MVIGDNCDTKFYFDGKFIREATSHRCLSPVSYDNEAEVYFTSTCTHVVIFQYDVDGSDLSFINAPTYSIHSFHEKVDPGTTMVAYKGMKRYTIWNKGKEVARIKYQEQGQVITSYIYRVMSLSLVPAIDTCLWRNTPLNKHGI